jgi:methyltransferase (TIGR00027 family)
MKPNRASETAYRAAISRAAHQLLDAPVVFHDPIALQILGPQKIALIRAGGRQFESRLARGLRAFFAARSRFAEDELARAVQRGVRQYVILGAGLDTFAHRNPHAGLPLRVFEVDHPSTQSWKQQQLAAAGLPTPSGLTYVPVNFEDQALADPLRLAGYQADAPAFFSWLGVSMYLTPDTVMRTLQCVAGATAAGGGIVFDYITPLAPQSLSQRLRWLALTTWLRAVGEPWRGFFKPDVLAKALKAQGFPSVVDMGADAINARYFNAPVNGPAVSGPGRLLCAQRWVS